MKKYLLIVFSLFSTLLAGGWGELEYAWITSFSIENYSQTSYGNMSRSHEHADEFVDNLRTRASAEGVSVRTNQSAYKYTDATVTESYMTGSTSNSSEFVFFAGRGATATSGSYDGGKLGLGPVTYDGGTVIPADKAYGSNYTKWVFYDASNTLRRTLTDLLQAFDGLHAIFGYNSSRVEAHSGTYGGTEDKWDEWSYQWITVGSTMWDAYKYSVSKHVYQELGYGEEIKVVYVKGTAASLTFNGADETFSNVYNDRAIGTARQYISRKSVVYGTPSY